MLFGVEMSNPEVPLSSLADLKNGDFGGHLLIRNFGMRWLGSLSTQTLYVFSHSKSVFNISHTRTCAWAANIQMPSPTRHLG